MPAVRSAPIPNPPKTENKTEAVAEIMVSYKAFVISTKKYVPNTPFARAKPLRRLYPLIYSA